MTSDEIPDSVADIVGDAHDSPPSEFAAASLFIAAEPVHVNPAISDAVT